MNLYEIRKKIEIEDFFTDGIISTHLISDDEQEENNVKKIGRLLASQIKNKEQVYDRRQRRNVLKDVVISKELKNNQIRKFYDSFLRIFNSKGLIDKEKKVQLLMLKSNAEYSSNRLGTKSFEIFLNNRINIVLKKEGKEFEKYMEALKLHFEALVGYFPKK